VEDNIGIAFLHYGIGFPQPSVELAFCDCFFTHNQCSDLILSVESCRAYTMHTCTVCTLFNPLTPHLVSYQINGYRPATYRPTVHVPPGPKVHTAPKLWALSILQLSSLDLVPSKAWHRPHYDLSLWAPPPVYTWCRPGPWLLPATTNTTQSPNYCRSMQLGQIKKSCGSGNGLPQNQR
jgi:hypothetical protein